MSMNKLIIVFIVFFSTNLYALKFNEFIQPIYSYLESKEYSEAEYLLDRYLPQDGFIESILELEDHYNLGMSSDDKIGGYVISLFYRNENNRQFYDFDRSIKWLLKSAELGYGKAQDSLAIYYAQQSNFEEAIKWATLASSSGEYNSQFLLSIIYDDEDLGFLDLKKSYEYALSAANLGHGDAQVNVALKYYLGRGVDVDVPKALGWLQYAATNAEDVRGGRHGSNKVLRAVTYHRAIIRELNKFDQAVKNDQMFNIFELLHMDQTDQIQIISNNTIKWNFENASCKISDIHEMNYWLKSLFAFDYLKGVERWCDYDKFDDLKAAGIIGDYHSRTNHSLEWSIRQCMDNNNSGEAIRSVRRKNEDIYASFSCERSSFEPALEEVINTILHGVSLED